MTDTLNEIRDKTFTESVDVDGTHFINCRFQGVQLSYGGGQMPKFEDCEFVDDFGWYFRDAALRTIQFLQVQNSDGHWQALINDMFQPGNFLSE
jgi:hypothetical protein